MCKLLGVASKVLPCSFTRPHRLAGGFDPVQAYRGQMRDVAVWNVARTPVGADVVRRSSVSCVLHVFVRTSMPISASVVARLPHVKNDMPINLSWPRGGCNVELLRDEARPPVRNVLTAENGHSLLRLIST